MDWKHWQNSESLTDIGLSEQLMLVDPDGQGITERAIRNLRAGRPACLKTVLLFMRVSEGKIKAETFDRWGIYDA